MPALFASLVADRPCPTKSLSPATDAPCEPARNKKSPALCGWHGAAKGNGGFALGGNHKHSEIPKQGDSRAGRMGLTQKIAPARPKSRGWAVTPHIPME